MLGHLISQKYGWREFNTFMDKYFRFADVELIDIVDPYLRIDASLALENGHEDVALEMVNRAIGKTYELSETIYHGFCEYMGYIPAEFVDARGEYLDGDRYSFGYERMWSRYEYVSDETSVIEFTWHRHDGFGREAGTVEMWVELIDKEAAPYL